MDYERSRRLLSRVISVAVLLGLLSTPAAQAQGTPDLDLAKEADPQVLYGETSRVELTASNPVGQPTGYNLSLRDVLPPGVSYVPGSAGDLVGEPRVVANAPTTGKTTLIWTNVSDLTANSQFSFTYRVDHDPDSLSVGDTYENEAGAYINCDARYVPDFGALGEPLQTGGSPDCSGTPAEESYTGFATTTDTTEIVAIELEKTEPSPESELLRGLHDHQTVYTLEVTNNEINPTNGIDLEDYLPAGIEFLGCGTEDNTTDAPTNPGSTEEYPGSGPIDQGGAAPAGCVVPDRVETIEDPPGLLPGVYTHVVWPDLADLGPGGTYTLRYVAAIPIRANALAWTGDAPAPESGEQAANLDNNSGPETDEDGGSEPAFTNHATATGTYEDGSPDGIGTSASDAEVVVAEDLRILKSRDQASLTPGSITEWTLNVATGEYRFVDDVEVTDTLGDGYCPLAAAGNLETTPPPPETECDAEPGAEPTPGYTSATENANGTWTLVWDDSTVTALERIEPSSTVEIAFPTRTRGHYQENFADADPVLARDVGRNDVAVTGADWIICAPGDPSPTSADTCAAGAEKIDADEPDGTVDADVSAAEQEAPGASIDKRLDSVPNTADCTAGNYVDSPATQTRPGDTLCYRLQMSFPAIDTGDVTVTDFLPPGVSYVPGSAQTMPAHTATIATASPPEPNVEGEALTWPLDDGSDTVDALERFDVVIKVRVDRSPASSDGDLVDNLLKAVFENTPGETFPLRDEVPYEQVQPELSLLKGVQQVNAGPVNPENIDGVTVSPGAQITYRVDVTNSGSLEASSSEVWDELPPGITCAHVTIPSITNGGVCNAAEDRIEWNGVAVPANDDVTLTYTVTIPGGFAPLHSLVNHAGVRSYESPSGSGPYTHIPAENIDPAQDPAANAPEADDPSNVVITNVTISKVRTTEIAETGNAETNQATIGEEIDYSVTVQIPAGTTLFGPNTRISDNLGTRHTLVGAPSGTVDTDGPGGTAPAPLPEAGLDLFTTGSTVGVDFPEPYANPLGSGTDIVVLNVTARVADVYPGNYAQGNAGQRSLGNTAQLLWEDADGTDRSRSASVSTEVVEPSVSLAKSNDATGPLSPGEVVTYTVTAANGNGARVSTAHDPVVVDELPDGLTPVNGGTPVADGGTVDPDGGVWDEGAQTITWNPGSLAPGASTPLTYDVIVDPDAIGGGTLVNNADLQATSLPATADGDGGERTSASTGSPPGYDAQAQSSVDLITGGVIKTSSPDERTVGEVLTTRVTVNIPSSIQNFDATVVDDLPDGLIFDQYVSATCTAGCAAGPTQISPQSLSPTDLGSGRTRIGWFLGDLSSAGVARTIELVYRSHVADTYDDGSDVVNDDTLVNVASFGFNLTDEVTVPPTAPPDPSTFDEVRTDDATTTVVEPLVTIDKAVSGDPDDNDVRDAEPGDAFTYTLTVTNGGDAPAFDVVVADEPDTELTNVLVAPSDDWTVTKDWETGDHAIGWLIPGPIPAGQSVKLSYTADLVPSAQLSDGDVATNTADVTEYFGVSKAEREVNGFGYRTYTDVDPDSVDVTVHVPDLALQKTTGLAGLPDLGPAAPEAAFPWRIVVTNPNVGSRLLAVDIVDTLPDNWTYISNSAQISGSGELTPGGQTEPTIDGRDLRWANAADLDGGETMVIEFQATPEPAATLDPGLGVAHVNDAAATGEDASGAAASAAGPYADDDTAEANLSAPQIDLALTKVADDPTPLAGTNVSWSLSVLNNGPNTAPAAVVEDTLPAGLTYVSAVPTRGTCEFTAGTLACALGELGPTGRAEIELVTAVDPAYAGEPIVNSAVVSDPAGVDADPANDSDEDEIVPGAAADLRIAKRIDGDLLLGKQARYVLEVTNRGPSDAADVVVSDPLPEELTAVSATGPNCSIAGQLVECEVGTMQPGEAVAIDIVASVDEFDANGIRNVASVGSATPDPNAANDEDAAAAGVSNTDLAIAKRGPAKITPGKTVGYSLVVSNVGSVASDGAVRVTDSLPRALKLLGASGSGWQCAIADRTAACERSDALPTGTSYPKISIRTRAGADLGSKRIRNRAEVSLNGDPVEANNEDIHSAASRQEAEESGDSCVGARLSAIPAKVFVGVPTRLKLVLEARSGEPVSREAVRLRHRPGGETEADRTNRRGVAMFEVAATSSADRWIARAIRCGAKEKVKAAPAPGCHARDAGANNQPEDFRRRC